MHTLYIPNKLGTDTTTNVIYLYFIVNNIQMLVTFQALNKCAAKNDILQSKQLSLKDLEIEKLKVLLQVKQNLKADEKQFIDK